MKLYAYNNASASAKALAEALGIWRIKHDGEILKSDLVINWGASKIKRRLDLEEMFNEPHAVARAVNKLQAFKCLDGHVPIPEWTEEQEVALKWLREGATVVCRTKLNGHSGQGLELMPNGDPDFHPEIDWVEAPLYTKYIPKKEEYRLHVFRDRVFFVQRKARNKGVPDDQVNWKVRNHANGFVFAHIGVDVPDVAKESAITAVRALGLDFGAVDMIWNQKEDKYYVIEVNTACGLEGTTLEKYVEVFKEFV
jgi:glutathione synthase/RimK-type ligase-like ATP-grasp enzyme